MSGNEEEQNPALDLLLPQRRFSREEWLTLIEHRLNSIKPYLDNFTLETMGEKHFLPYGSGFNLTELRENKITFDGWTEGVLDSQGLFFASPRCDWEQWDYEKERIEMPLWGMLRNGSLVSMTLYLDIKNHRVDGDKHSGSVGDVVRVVIKETDVATILSFYPDAHLEGENNGPSHLWWQLGKQIEEFVSRRGHLYRDAQKLQKQFELEDMLLKRTGADKREETEKDEVACTS